MQVLTMFSSRGSLENPSAPARKRACPDENSEDDSCTGVSCGLDGGMREAKSEMLVPALPMINQIDWRRVLCQFLGITFQIDDNAILASLQTAKSKLEAAERSIHMSSKDGSTEDMNYQTIHRIRCAEQSTTELCRDVPWPVRNADERIHLRGSGIIDNLELHLERHKWVTFLVYKDYTCCKSDSFAVEQQQPLATITDNASVLLANESVSIVSEDFGVALDELWSIAVGNASHPKFDQFKEFSAPFVWWYCQRDRLQAAIPALESHHLQHIRLFQAYINTSLGYEYESVDQLLREGRITAEYMPYLYILGEIQLSKLDGHDPRFHRAFKATSWLQTSDAWVSRSQARVNYSAGSKRFIFGSSWSYDGFFQKNTGPWTVNCDFPWEKSFDIQELDVYPLRFAGLEVIEALRHRGEMFWKCQKPKYICYQKDRALRAQNPSDARYMIDINTYKVMYPPPQTQTPNRDDLGPEATGPDAPPPQEDGFILCLPSTIPGYHMHKKEWATLYVSCMSEVQWNVNAFEMLVVDKQKKELIRALVTNQIAAEESTDLMCGKGSGLFILLHGGPGTGKTLTAESVAEIAQKPLYRVTCGDVGTKAEDVERYLETVLLLGKTWGCVVLLDEADVFLMQRSVEDFERNALVSVFLRVLEYYDGILILTSNRVGTFDAAFKSRIQLSLHYPRLKEKDRLEIWTNFIEHIEGLTSSRTASLGILSEEIKEKLPELSKEALNGREIRNAVSTARQLAMFNGEPVGYKHLQTVISEMKKFDEYATDLQGGLTDDEVARIHHEY